MIEDIYRWYIGFFENSNLTIFAINIIRYFVFTLSFYFLLNSFLRYRKIQNSIPSLNVIISEIFYSVLGLIVLSTVSLISISVYKKTEPKIYMDFFEHSIPFHLLVFIVFIIYQDLYFYIIHRLLHTDFFYKKIHHIHHQYTNPTVFTFLAQHPLDLLMQAAGNLLFVYLLPIHPMDLFINSFFLTLINVYGHSGYELFPGWFVKNKFTKYITTSTNHNMHHSHNQCNYGLWLTIWDRVFGTLHSDYEKYYDQIQEQIKINKK